MSTDEFDVSNFENELISLKDTQEGIQQMSSWCLTHRVHHKKIVSSWLNVLKQVRVEHRLILFYLANDVIQYSKRKSYEFVDSWGTALQKATTMVRDEKVRIKVDRIFKIWKQREIYSDEYLSDLNGLLNMNPIKKNSHQCTDNNDDFQTSILISRLFECNRLSTETDKNFIKLSNPPSCSMDVIKNTLKDKCQTEDMEKDIQKFSKTLEFYIKSLQSEMTSRKLLICNIEQAENFYSNQRGEVKVVVNAYKNFGGRIRNVKKKLEEISAKLPSPIPSPDLDAPSPEPDADISLPEDTLSTNLFKSSNGYVSYMDGNLPFDINDFKSESNKSLVDGTQAIEVINSRSEENVTNDYEEDPNFFKSSGHKHFPYPGNRTPPSSLELNYEMSKAYSPGQHTYDSRSNSYNTVNTSYGDNPNYAARFPTRNYQRTAPLIPPPPIPATLVAQTPEFNSPWSSDQPWTSSSLFENHMDTPVSPPHFEREGISSNIVEYIDRESGITMQDVDHRQLPHTPVNSNKVHVFSENERPVDVDHRNLISLTGSPGSKPPAIDFREKDNCNMYEKQHNNLLDIDYRQHCLKDGPHTNIEIESHQHQLQPPPFPPHLESPSCLKKSKLKHHGNRTKPMQYQINIIDKSSSQEDSVNDIIEAIDMEMSDDDFDDHFGDDDKEEIEDSDKPDSSSTSPAEMVQSQSRVMTKEMGWNHQNDSNQMNKDDSHPWRNQKNSSINYNHPDKNNQQTEYRRFFNPAGRIMQQKNNFQTQSKSRGSPYFNRGFNGSLRGGNMNNRRGGHFRGRPWK